MAAIFFPGVDFMGSVATALVVGVGGWLVLGDALTAGTLVAFLLYVDRFFDPIRELAQRYNTFQATMAASERIFGLIDTLPDLDDQPDAIELPPVEGVVDFDHVSFAYSDGEPVLRMSTTCRSRPAYRAGRRDRRRQEHDHPPAGPFLRCDRRQRADRRP